MPPKMDPVTTRTLNAWLIAPLALIVIGAAAVIVELERLGSLDVIAWVGMGLMLVGPLLTIVRVMWLSRVARTARVGQGTRAIAIASFSVGSIIPVILLLIIARNSFSHMYLLLLIPAVLLAVHAGFIEVAVLETELPRRRTAALRNERRRAVRASIPEETEAPAPTKAIKDSKGMLPITVCPKCGMRVIPKGDRTCPSCGHTFK